MAIAEQVDLGDFALTSTHGPGANVVTFGEQAGDRFLKGVLDLADKGIEIFYKDGDELKKYQKPLDKNQYSRSNSSQL